MDNLYWYKHIDRPTQVRKDDAPSTLDLVISTSVDYVLNIYFRPPLGKSDHVVLEIYMNTNVQREGTDTLRYNYINAGYESIQNFISSLNIMHGLKTSQVPPDSAFEFLKEVLK